MVSRSLWPSDTPQHYPQTVSGPPPARTAPMNPLQLVLGGWEIRHSRVTADICVQILSLTLSAHQALSQEHQAESGPGPVYRSGSHVAAIPEAGGEGMREEKAVWVIPYPQSKVQSIFLATLTECDGLPPSCLVAEPTVKRSRATRLAAGVHCLHRGESREGYMDTQPHTTAIPWPPQPPPAQLEHPPH